MESHTKTASHTPGPWATHRSRFPVDGQTDYAIVAGQQVIAEAFGRSDRNVYPPAEANARLIAAAPDLLAALEGIASLRGKTLLGPDSRHHMGDAAPRFHERGAAAAFEQTADLADSAIAKAKGGEPHG
jgi:hypothetical protein